MLLFSVVFPTAASGTVTERQGLTEKVQLFDNFVVSLGDLARFHLHCSIALETGFVFCFSVLTLENMDLGITF